MTATAPPVGLVERNQQRTDRCVGWPSGLRPVGEMPVHAPARARQGIPPPPFHYRLPRAAARPSACVGKGRRHLRVRARPRPSPLPKGPVDGRRGPDHGLSPTPRLPGPRRRGDERGRNGPRHGADRGFLDGRRSSPGDPGRSVVRGRSSPICTAACTRSHPPTSFPRRPWARGTASSTWISTRSTS